MCKAEQPTFNTPEEHITSQYGKVAGAVNTMFLELRKRTIYEVWRSNGIGSCSILTEDSDTGIDGHAKDLLLSLRREKNPNAYERTTHCGYHQENHGCILGDLKSPYCLSHIENSGELKNRFGINGQELKALIDSALDRILQGGTDPDKKDSALKPEASDQYVSEVTQQIQDITNRATEFPILTEGDIRKQTKRFCNYFLNEAT